MSLHYLELTLHPLVIPQVFAGVLLKSELEEMFPRTGTSLAALH